MRIYLLLLGVVSVLFLVSCTTPGDISSLRQRVEENPNSAPDHHELALAYVKHGVDWEVMGEVGIPVITSKRWTNKAKKEFQKVAELDPKDPEPHYWLKVIYNAQGKYEEADKEADLYTDLVAREHKSLKK